MSKSARPTAAESLAVVRLVHECGELGADADVWQEHLADGLRHLTGARYATVGLLPADPNRADQPLPTSAAGDWPSAEFERRFRAWLKRPTADPTNPFTRNPALVAFLDRPEHTLAVSRAELVPDREWDRSWFAGEVLRPAGVDDSLVARQPVAVAGGMLALTASRFVGDRRFPVRSVRVIELIQRELARHLGRRLWVTTQPNLAGLPPRQRQVLDGLLEGDLEKQVAAKLELAPATVHIYVTRIYRHFGVNSRAELLAYFLRRYRRPSKLRIPHP